MWKKADLSSPEELMHFTVEFLKEKKGDTRLIRLYELKLKQLQASEAYLQLDKEQYQLKLNSEMHVEMIKLYNEIIQNPKNLKKYSTEIVYHILYLLPHLKKWILHIDSLHTLTELSNEIFISKKKYSSSDLSDSIKKKINALPQEISTKIWYILYDRCANHVQEAQWSENHFHEHLEELSNIVSDLTKDLEGLLSYKDFNTNPLIRFLEPFVQSPTNIGFHYPKVD